MSNLSTDQLSMLKRIYMASLEHKINKDEFVASATPDESLDFFNSLKGLLNGCLIEIDKDSIFLTESGIEKIESVYPWLNIVNFAKQNDEDLMKIDPLPLPVVIELKHQKIRLLREMAPMYSDIIKNTFLEIAKDLEKL
jgi:hypothetical protein